MVSETTHPAVEPGALDDRAFASEGAFGSSLANFLYIGAACNFGIGQNHRGPARARGLRGGGLKRPPHISWQHGPLSAI